MTVKQRINTLIVDDSAMVRQTLTNILSDDPKIQVMGTASDAFAAAKKIERQVPDVITLDIEMPRMDGLTFLRKIMTQHPIPVVICSSVSPRNSENAMTAMQYGAVSIVEKPEKGAAREMEEFKVRITDAVKAAARADLKKLHVKPAMKVDPKLTADVVLPSPIRTKNIPDTQKLIIVGASTGGTEALAVLLQQMPVRCPPIVIVQHMPGHFTETFSQRLNDLCAISVKEARSDDVLKPGLALMAPGDAHLLLKRTGTRYFVEVKKGPLVRRHRPSVDVLFRSAARYAGHNAVGVILTGMGDDGAMGMKEMHDAGAYNIAQNEATCVVFGMPQEAIKSGGVDKVLPLNSIAPTAVSACEAKAKRKL